MDNLAKEFKERDEKRAENYNDMMNLLEEIA